MMVHTPLCTHKDPKNILIVSDRVKKFEDEIAKHSGMESDAAPCSLEALSKLDDAKYDVVISEIGVDPLVVSQINRILKDDGIIVTSIASLDETEEAKGGILTLGQYAKIVMPFHLGNGEVALLASKAYHPTADLILQRSDMLDGLEYYNCDVHIGAFAMGNYIRKNYLGVIKN